MSPLQGSCNLDCTSTMERIPSLNQLALSGLLDCCSNKKGVLALKERNIQTSVYVRCLTHMDGLQVLEERNY